MPQLPGRRAALLCVQREGASTAVGVAPAEVFRCMLSAAHVFDAEGTRCQCLCAFVSTILCVLHRCDVGSCGRFYHPKCLKMSASELEEGGLIW